VDLTTVSVTVKHRFEAPPDVVFALLTDAQDPPTRFGCSPPRR
jgi:hypothetical protein